METKDICRKAINHYGMFTQIDKAIEEMGELIVALEHFKNRKLDKEAIVTEIADVQIMTKQLSLIFGETEVAREVEFKLHRLDGRIQYEKEKNNDSAAQSDCEG